MKKLALAAIFAIIIFSTCTQQTAPPSSLSSQNDHTVQKSTGHWNNPNYSPQDMQRREQYLADVFQTGFIIGAIAALSIAIWLLSRCYMKRKASRQVKELMQQKRYQYASTLGINLYELNNNPRLAYTIHV